MKKNKVFKYFIYFTILLALSIVCCKEWSVNIGTSDLNTYYNQLMFCYVYTCSTMSLLVILIVYKSIVKRRWSFKGYYNKKNRRVNKNESKKV